MKAAAIAAAACAAGAAALLTQAGDAAAPAPAPPQASVLRGCDSLSEPPPGRIAEGWVRIGPVAVPGGFERSPASTFASRAQDVGFRRYILGRRGRALPAAERRRLIRLAPSYHAAIKFPVLVPGGFRGVLTVAPGHRAHAALLFSHGGGRQIGPYWSHRIADGTAAVALEGCAGARTAFAGAAVVAGAVVVAGARCVTFQVWSEGAEKPVERALPFGVRICPERVTDR